MKAFATTRGVSFGNWRLSPVAATELQRSTLDGRVVYRHLETNIVEWYQRHPTGIEQGFTVSERPRGDLVLTHRVVGSVNVTRDGATLKLGEVSLGGLSAQDALGRSLPVTLDWAGPGRSCGAEGLGDAPLVGCVVLRLPEGALAMAALPIVIDPLFTTEQWVVSSTSTQPNSQFGRSLSSAGDVNGDGFADVIVGAALWSGEATFEGRAFLYLGSATGISPTAAWVADPTDLASANFGFSVAGVGDINGDGFADVVIGADTWSGPIGTQEGRAFVYLGSSAGLPAAPSAELSSSQATSNFGFPVAGAGDVNADGFADVIVGSRYWNGDGGLNQGRAEVFLGGPNGLATLAAWAANPAQQVAASFGSRLSSAGDINGDGFGDVAIGVYAWDGQAVDEGRVYVYLGSDAGLSADPSWFDDPLDQTTGRFSSGVASAGDVNGDGFGDLIVGGFGWASDAGPDEGRAWLYLGNPTGAPVLAQLLNSAAQAGAVFGYSVAGAGDVNGDGFSDVLVGAFGFDDVASGEGRAYLYVGDRFGVQNIPAWTANPTRQTFGQFGNELSGAGDVNGDGLADTLVAAPVWDDLDAGAANVGRAWAYLGQTLGLGPSPSGSFSGLMGTGYGAAVARAGDVNGDGFTDALVGAPGVAGGGQAVLLLGSAFGLTSSSWVTLSAMQPGAGLGSVVASAGDVDGDGLADVLVAAPDFTGAAAREGRVWLYRGSADSGLEASPSWVADPTDLPNARFGKSLAAADFNGDGLGDVVVAATGQLYLYLGSPAGLGALADATLSSGFDTLALSAADSNADAHAELFVVRAEAAGQRGVLVFRGGPSGLSPMPFTALAGDAGSESLASGDLDGDGLDELVVGAPQADEVWLLLDGGAPPPRLSPGQAGVQFGRALTTGDFDGDGLFDLAVGAPLFDTPVVDEGRVFLFPGRRTSGPSPVASWTTLSSGAPSSRLGESLSAGDFNGDGFSDLLVGAPGADRVVVFSGGDLRPGLPRRQRQHAAGALGRAGSTLGPVTLEARATQEGTLGGRLRVDFEVQPLGARFTGRPTHTSAPVVGGALASATVRDLPPGGYHWRSKVRYPVGSGSGRWVSYGDNPESEPDFRIVESRDGGTDGGQPDAGEPDPTDGGPGDPRHLTAGCGCSAGDGLALLALAVLAHRRGRRPVTSASP